MVHHALKTEFQEIYLNFDHFWMNRVFDIRRQVFIKCIHQEQLASYIVVDPVDIPITEAAEKFYVLVSLPSKAFDLDSVFDLNAIDGFLTKNPCWIPVHEPQIPSLDPGVSEYSHLYGRSAIFIRLPTFPYHSTCLLYSLITRIQFPNECPTNTSNVLVNHLGKRKNPIGIDLQCHELIDTGNIGWANCLHPLVEHFIDAMHNSKIYIVPRAWDNGAATNIKRFVGGEEREVSV